jgi:hypothetical protein
LKEDPEIILYEGLNTGELYSKLKILMQNVKKKIIPRYKNLKRGAQKENRKTLIFGWATEETKFEYFLYKSSVKHFVRYNAPSFLTSILEKMNYLFKKDWNTIQINSYRKEEKMNYHKDYFGKTNVSTKEGKNEFRYPVITETIGILNLCSNSGERKLLFDLENEKEVISVELNNNFFLTFQKDCLHCLLPGNTERISLVFRQVK